MKPPHKTVAPRQERAREVAQYQTQHIPNTYSVNFRKALTLDHVKISALFASRYLPNLSETMDMRPLRNPHAMGGPWLLPPIPRVVIKTHRDAMGCVTELSWFDAESGIGGNGVVGLAALVLSVTESEAAGRAAYFLSSTMDAFLLPDLKSEAA